MGCVRLEKNHASQNMKLSTLTGEIRGRGLQSQIKLLGLAAPFSQSQKPFQKWHEIIAVSEPENDEKGKQ